MAPEEGEGDGQALAYPSIEADSPTGLAPIDVVGVEVDSAVHVGTELRPSAERQHLGGGIQHRRELDVAGALEAVLVASRHGEDETRGNLRPVPPHQPV